MRASMHGEADCRDFPVEKLFHAKVFLDGVEQKFAVVADEEESFVERYVEARGDCCQGTEIVRGKVEIRLG